MSNVRGPSHYCEWETGPSGHVFCRICGVARNPDPVIALLQQIEQNTRRDDSAAEVSRLQAHVNALSYEMIEHGYTQEEIDLILAIADEGGR